LSQPSTPFVRSAGGGVRYGEMRVHTFAIARSGVRETVFMIAGIAVHDQLERPFRIIGIRIRFDTARFETGSAR
jgi:hypothetical protein